MAIKRIDKKSPYYPLPSDYYDERGNITLTEEGARLARVNATRLWMIPKDDPYWSPDLLVRCLLFYDNYYLRHEMGMFYPFGFEKPNPTFHNDIVRNISAHPRVVLASPRDSAKSSLIRKLMSLWQISCPQYHQIYAACTHARVKETMTILRNIGAYNTRIRDDFNPEYGGELVPSKGKGLPFGNDIMYFNNHSMVAATSIKSAVRGGRPHKLILDDIEQDYAPNTDTELRRQEIDEKLNRELLPMVFNAGSGCIWIGTTISLRHFIALALNTDEEGKAIDHRFDNWCRMRYQVLRRKDGERIESITPYLTLDNPEETLESLWPSRYSVSDYLQMARTIGPEVFMAEYMSDPRIGEGTSFFIEDRHCYTIHEPDEHLESAPWKSNTLIKYENSEGIQTTKTMREFLAESWVFQCVDWAATVTPSSDYSAIGTIAITPDKQLFVMDMWSDKVLAPDLAAKAVHLAARWRPAAVGVEAPDVTFHLFHLIKTQFESHKAKIRLVPLKHNIPKSQRIDGLKWRFGIEGQNEPTYIKLPYYRRKEPAMSRLFSQLLGFNPYVEGGNLANDDELDTVAMVLGLVPGIPNKIPRSIKKEEINPLEEMAKGKVYDDMGNPLALQLNWSQIPRHKMIEISRKLEDTQNNKSSGVYL